MDAGEVITRVRNSLDGYSESVLEILDDNYIFNVMNQAAMELRRELRRPISENDIVLLSGKRGVNLPSDFLELADEVTSVRIEPDGQSSEGEYVAVVSETELYA